jgi:ankyrin repeat protein
VTLDIPKKKKMGKKSKSREVKGRGNGRRGEEAVLSSFDGISLEDTEKASVIGGEVNDLQDDEEVKASEEMRKCILDGDATDYLAILSERKIETTPIVYLMEWFHTWQQEYEILLQVLEAEEDDSNTESNADQDIEEMEAEAEGIIHGFGTICLHLLECFEENVDSILDKYGWTLLMQASNVGLRELMDTLIDMGANVNCKTSNGQNALFLAIQSEHTNEAMLLLKNGAVESALQIVTTNTKTPKDDEEEEEENMEEDTAFFQACRSGNAVVVQEMIALGVNVNFSLPSSGDRALHVAVMYEAEDVIDLLLAHEKIEMNAKNLMGQTCLFGCSNAAIVDNLLKSGIDANAVDVDGETALSIAVALVDTEVVALLRARGCK